MEGRISETGFLYLTKNGKEYEQFCPFAQNNKDGIAATCGMWCPLFGEPDVYEANPTVIVICKTVLHIKNFKDGRKL